MRFRPIKKSWLSPKTAVPLQYSVVYTSNLLCFCTISVHIAYWFSSTCWYQSPKKEPVNMVLPFVYPRRSRINCRLCKIFKLTLYEIVFTSRTLVCWVGLSTWQNFVKQISAFRKTLFVTWNLQVIFSKLNCDFFLERRKDILKGLVRQKGAQESFSGAVQQHCLAYRGPPVYIGWRNRFLWIYCWAP
jgi:hypothetical protein